MPKKGYISITVPEIVYNALEKKRKELDLKTPSKTIAKILGVVEN